MDGQVIIGTKLDTKSFDMQIKEVEYQLKQLDYELSHAKELKLDSRTIQEYELKAEKLTNQLASLRKKQEDLNTTNLSGVTAQLNNIGNGVEGVIKKVARWGLAIFGIRTAYMFVRQSMSVLSGYNEQLASNLEYIRFALASALEPIIVRIVQWVYKLLSLVGTIIKLLTGYDIFKNSGVDKYQKAMESSKKSLSKGAKSAKEINKQLAGFDEMNVLSDNSSKNAGSGEGDGTTLPNLKLDSNMKLPKWMEELLGHGDKLIAIILGIVGALKALKMGFGLIQALGIGIMVAGIVYAIEGLLKYLKDPSWENFGQIIKGIGIALIGLAIAIGSVPVAIAGVAVLITGIVIANWDKIRGIFDKAIEWLTTQMNNVKDKYGYFAGLIVKGVRDQVQNIRNSLNTIFTNAKKILDNIINFVRNVFTGNWKGAWQNLSNIANSVMQILITSITFKLRTIKNVLTSAFGVIGDVIGGAIRGAVNAVFRYIENKINSAISMFNGVLSVVNKLTPGVRIGRISTVRLPRLAKGGIVNMPGRGINYGGANIAERGAEGIIPLTDSQQMALLGEAIGRYITVNANITNTMNGRVISREIQRVQNQSNFAMNR